MRSARRAFLLRQLRRPGRQMGMFVLCVVLSIVTIVAANGFSDAVNRTVLKDVRSLQAADILVRSSYPLSAAVEEKLASLTAEGVVQSAMVHELYSVVRTSDESASLLSDLKVVSAGYPFYGQVLLASGRPFAEALTPGNIVVESAFLNRLGLRVGDAVWVGAAEFLIADVLEREPDRPLELFSMGPRVFINALDMERLDLVKPGSRVQYRRYIRVVDESALNEVYNQLKTAASDDERVDTYRTTESRPKRFFDNFLIFLSLMGVLTLFLSGIGIQSAVTAYLQEMTQSVAVMKTLGATHGFVVGTFLSVVMIFGVIATFIGIAIGYGLQRFMAVFLSEILPVETQLALQTPVILESVPLGLGVVALFSLLPLNRLRGVKPVIIFRKEVPATAPGWRAYLIVGGTLFLLAAVILRRMPTPLSGIYVLAGMAGLIAASAILALSIFWAIRRLPVRRLSLAQAKKGLYRPGNRTRSILITFSAAFAAIFTLYTVERRLEEAFVSSYPPDAPNLFFIDIQPDQISGVREVLGQSAPFFPLVRARLVSINDRLVDPSAETRRRGDNLSRPFNLTYRQHLLDDERLSKGPGLFDDTISGVQVSVLDTVARMGAMKIGDRLRFNIQGIALEAVVASIRTREKETLRPFFYFVFKEEALSGAPSTLFSAVRVDETQKSSLQNEMASRFPNVTTLDMSASVNTFYRVMTRLSSTIRFLGLFSILAGMLILTGSIFATRIARTREAVYFRILGADRGFVRRVFNYENLAIGLASGTMALLMSHAASWWIIVRWMQMSYRWYFEADILLVAMAVILVMGVGWAASGDILRKKPVAFLREETVE